jgi:hypothetical protein
MEIELRIDPGTLGHDVDHPEAFARYCEERLAREYPDAHVDVVIGIGASHVPEDLDRQALWDDYCQLPLAEYVRLADAIPADRRGEYLERVQG